VIDHHRSEATPKPFHQPTPDLAGALAAATGALRRHLEVALLDRVGARRCFRRLDDAGVAALLSAD
jgi:hypothetical protein